MDRRKRWFDPYHAALDAEVDRLRTAHGRVVAYDCHSILSVVPRLFDGRLPAFNVGTNGGASCAPKLQGAVMEICRGTGRSAVANGRFRGGFITRRLGRPGDGIHAMKMELACRAYMREPEGAVGEVDWPTSYDPAHAASARQALERVLEACLAFALAG